MSARFEVVRTDADQPWHSRFIAENGEEVWRTSENYVREEGALDAIMLLERLLGVTPSALLPEVRMVDERGRSDA